MKAIIKYTGMILGMVLAASCTNLDYPDRYKETSGVPTVHFVRYADRDIAITQANMEELVCVVGDNLTSVHDIYFNDQAAVLNSSYGGAQEHAQGADGQDVPDHPRQLRRGL